MSQLSETPIYETIGKTYSATRQPDVRIATQIRHALGDVTRVINVGAGAGSYEPTDCDVVAIDPSITMLRQRSLPQDFVKCSESAADKSFSCTSRPMRLKCGS
jgi:hypothetical protein